MSAWKLVSQHHSSLSLLFACQSSAEMTVKQGLNFEIFCIVGPNIQVIWLQGKFDQDIELSVTKSCMHILYTSNEKVFNTKRVIRTATKRTETSVWPPTQCTYIPSPLCCTTVQWIRDVHVCALVGGHAPVFVLFVAVLITLFFKKLFSLFLCTRLLH